MTSWWPVPVPAVSPARTPRRAKASTSSWWRRPRCSAAPPPTPVAAACGSRPTRCCSGPAPTTPSRTPSSTTHAVVGDRTPRELQETYVRSGAPLIEYLEADEQLKFSVLPWPDYFGKAPKARADGMRHIAAKPLQGGRRARSAGADPRSAGLRPTRRAATRRLLRRRPRPDRPIPHGDKAVPERLDPAEHRTGRTGRRGRPGRRRHRRGGTAAPARSVPAAACCWRPAASSTTTNCASKYGVPGESRDTMGPWGNQGLAHLAGIAAGADTDLMDQAWWSPGLTHPDGRSAFALWFTGGIFVNQDGKRFVNESQAYDRLGREVVAAAAPTARSRCRTGWSTTTTRGRRCRRSRPPTCRWSNPRSTSRPGCGTPPTPWRNWPPKIGVPPQNLVDTVARFNEFVARGVDDDFGRGDEAYDRAFSGGAPPLYAIDKAAVPRGRVRHLRPGHQGRAAHRHRGPGARRLRATPIPGLYAAGNTMAAPSGTAYPGGGNPIGTSMVFSHLAVKDMLDR